MDREQWVWRRMLETGEPRDRAEAAAALAERMTAVRSIRIRDWRSIQVRLRDEPNSGPGGGVLRRGIRFLDMDVERVRH